MRPHEAQHRFTLARRDLLRWLYLARMALVTGILLGAILAWSGAEPTQTLVATVLFLASTLLTGASFLTTHLRGLEPGDNFVWVQVLFDVLLVTAVVHVTGGGDSPFAFLYILVISAGALLLPLPGGVLAGILAAILFMADVVALNLEELRPRILLQTGLFTLVAVVTGWLGDRVRRAGLALGRVESALRRLQVDTDRILTKIGTGVLTVDAEGCLLYLNPAGEALLDLDAKNWRGAPVLDAVDRAAPGLASVLVRSLRTKRPVSRFKTLARRNGVEAMLGVSTTVLEGEEGEAPSVTAIFQDITDQERLEALNRQNERLEAVAELGASLAHEIKNPLSSIRSAVEQLARDPLPPSDRQTLERLILAESDRLTRLLSEFLEFSALRLGKTGEVDVVGLVADCLAMVGRHQEIPEGVSFKQEGTPGAVRIPGDVDLLHRAVFNLLLNAAQFAGPGGTVRVEVLAGDGCPSPPGEQIADPVCIRVSDSGPGVPPQDLPRIFDPFFTRRKGGTGLGLAVVHRAVEVHAGLVSVGRSREGGAEFSIFLPGSKARIEEET